MPHAALSAAVARARRATVPEPASDGRLLGAFVASRDADAFAELVRRFGPMVFAVCRKLTGHHHDAEDAFQAAFVVLARRAGVIAPREAVGPWLHAVAVRVARKARAVSSKRTARVTPTDRPPAVATTDREPDDLAAVLHEEVAGLPEKFRTLVVLCDLRGGRQAEVAEWLGLAVGTVYSRLAAARKLLGERLRKRGVGLSAAGLGTALAEAGTAAVPARLAASAVAVGLSPESASAVVTALTTGVFRTMLLHKLTAAGVAAVALAACALAANPAPPAASEPPKPPVPLVLVPAADDKKPEPAKPAGPGTLLLSAEYGPTRALAPDGKKVADLGNPPGKIHGWYGGWLSPDGTRAAVLVIMAEPEPEPDDYRTAFRVNVYRLDKPDEPDHAWDFTGYWVRLRWTADGKKLIGTRRVGKHPDVSFENLLLDPATGETSPLDLPAGVRVLDAAKDGKTFVVETYDKKARQWGIGLATLGRKDVRHLTDLLHNYPGDADARLSPDGTTVLLIDGDPARKNAHSWGCSERPYLVAVATGKRTPLADFPENGRALYAVWSPDGKRVAYTWKELHEELLKKDEIGGADLNAETHAYLVVADGDGRNAKTVATQKGTSPINPILGTIDWR